jgi:3-oxoacyl-[acyl-carrier-protein] synthase II
MKPARGIISGVGIVTGYGLDSSSCIEGLLSGDAAPATRERASWPDDFSPLRINGMDPADVRTSLPSPQLRAITPESLMLQAAARAALADAELDLEEIEPERIGVAVSTQQAGLQDYAEQLWAGVREESGMVSPTHGPWTGFNAPAGHLGICFNAQGPNVTALNGAVGGIEALGYAIDALAADRADAMLVCGVEVISPAAVAVLNSFDGAWRPRPFDRDRNGPAYGDAGAAILLESAKTCADRGGSPRATVMGVNTAHSSRGNLEGASIQALTRALKESSCELESVGACFAGANGSVDGDAAEAHAIGTVLGAEVPTCAIKGGIGECTAAGAVAQAALAVLSIERRVIPPTPGFESLDPAMRLRVTNRPEQLLRNTVVVHAWDEDCAAGAAILQPYYGRPTTE